MSLIKPNSHFENNEISGLIPIEYPVGTNLIKLVIADFLNKPLLYSGKKISLDIDSTIFDGTLLISTDNEPYLLTDTPTNSVIVALSRCNFLTTFAVRKDNENVTFGDIKDSMREITTNFEVEGIEMIGNYGLLSPDNYTKLNALVQPKIYNDLVVNVIDTTSFTNIGTVKIEYNYGIFKHRFGIVGEITTQIFEIELNINSNLYELRKINFAGVSTLTNLECNLRLTKGTYLGSPYLFIEYIPTITGTYPGLNKFHYAIHYSNNPNNVLVLNPGLSVTEFLTSKSSQSSNFGTLTSSLLFNSKISRYSNNNSVEESSYLPATININTVINDGTYLGLFANLATTTNLPAGIVNNYTIVNRKIHAANSGVYQIIQTLYTYSASNKPTIFQRIITNTFVTAWVDFAVHTHLATDITTDANHQFVTAAQIATWNSYSAAGFWRNPVATFADLATTYPTAVQGTNVLVLDTKEIYVWYASVWQRLYPIVSQSNNGLMSGIMYDEFFVKSSVSKKIVDKDSYIHRLSSLTELELELYPDKALDLVQRDTLTESIGENSIAIGYGDTAAYGTATIALGSEVISRGELSIGIGTNILSEFNRTIAIGHNLLVPNDRFGAFGNYNLGLPENLFEYGYGVSDLERKNLFWVDANEFMVSKGYKIIDGTGDKILVADGTTKPLAEISAAIIENINETFKTNLHVKVSDLVGGNYILDWTEELIQQFGRLGNFDVWVKVGENSWNKEVIPVTMSSMMEEDPENPANNIFTAIQYVFNLSGFEALILIR